MKRIYIFSLFIKFLIKNKAFWSYFKNFSFGEFVPSLKRSLPRYYIKGTFTWIKTNEGYSFWKELDKKWKDTLTKKLKPKFCLFLDFCEFLYERGIGDSYFKSLKMNKISKRTLIEEVYPVDWCIMINWTLTKEGKEFWREVDEYWTKKLKEDYKDSL